MKMASPLPLAEDVLGVLAAKALEKKAHSLEGGRSLSLNYTQTSAGGVAYTAASVGYVPDA